MVPLRRPAGATHEVTRYRSARESVSDYFEKLNSGRAYLPMRLIRKRLRDQGRPIDGLELAVGLERYSERGVAYVHEIQGMIRSNRLLEYDV